MLKTFNLIDRWPGLEREMEDACDENMSKVSDVLSNRIGQAFGEVFHLDCWRNEINHFSIDESGLQKLVDAMGVACAIGQEKYLFQSDAFYIFSDGTNLISNNWDTYTNRPYNVYVEKRIGSCAPISAAYFALERRVCVMFSNGTIVGFNAQTGDMLAGFDGYCSSSIAYVSIGESGLFALGYDYDHLQISILDPNLKQIRSYQDSDCGGGDVFVVGSSEFLCIIERERDQDGWYHYDPHLLETNVLF